MPVFRVLFLLALMLGFGQVARADSDQSYRFRVCNEATKGTISVAVAVYEDPEDSSVTIHGWWSLAQGECKVVAVRRFGRYSSHTIFVHGHTQYSTWPKEEETATKFCLSSDRYERRHSSGYTCRNNEQLREFAEVLIKKSESGDTTYTTNLVDNEDVQFE